MSKQFKLHTCWVSAMIALSCLLPSCTSSDSSAGASGATSSSGGASSMSGTTGGMNNSGGGTSVGGMTHTGPWKIMMLGDSITATTCYPQLVWQDLRAAGHTNFTFIGSFINNQSCSVSGLPAGGLPTEGHSGELVATDANNGSVLNWFQTNPPDIV